MKILNTFILFFCIILSNMSMAQSQLTLEDLIPGGKNYSKYRVSYPKQMQWWGDVPLYVKGDSVVTIPLKQGERSEVVFDRKQAGLDLGNGGVMHDLSGISFPFEGEKIMLVNRGGNSYLYNFEKGKTDMSYIFPKDAAGFDFSEKSRAFAYTVDNNLYVLDSEKDTHKITSDSDKGIVNGQSVHQNEFGISKGTFWSPFGNYLAFYRMDETMVSDYPLVDASGRIAKVKELKYPMAGMKSHHVTVGVYDMTSRTTVFLETGAPKEKYLTNIAWSPDEQYIYIAELNRGQDTCRLVRYETVSGKRDVVLFEETSSKYVEPENPILFCKNNEKTFIWQSEKDGFNHLYLYDTDGTLKKQLTKGNWDVTEVLGFDASGDNLYIVSTEVSPIEKHIYELNLKNGKRTKLSVEEGVHFGLLSKSGKYLLDIYTSQYNPGKVVVTDVKKRQCADFFQAKNPYAKVTLPEITLGTLKANDGKTDLYYRLVKPTNFDENKKYPVIVYVYGGPHSQLVDNSWMAQVRGWDIYMAQKGYVVFTLDNRGTKNRGIDFENITHRRLGVIETQDQMTGVDFLKSQSFVDADNIGVHGWSYGGFMTLNLMLRHPDVFKVGVAGGPVTDWKYYEIMYGERYMDSPKENPEGYAETSMVDRAGDLKGRLMLIHGDEDPVVVMQHSLQFLKSAIKKGTHPDFFVYPGHGHNMTGRDRVHLHEHITRYFDDFLK